jgi:hypothetical protein
MTQEELIRQQGIVTDEHLLNLLSRTVHNFIKIAAEKGSIPDVDFFVSWVLEDAKDKLAKP